MRAVTPHEGGDSAVAADPKNVSILLVDDAPNNLVALEAILDPLGHKLVKAGSGEEALKHLLQGDFALILLDVQMPGIDGFETASLIKSHTRTASIPIIFITAISRDAAHVFKGYAHGAVDYMLKPFDPDILRSKVAVFVDLHVKAQKIRQQAAMLRQRDMELLERRGQERYRRLAESMPLLMWGARADGTFYYGNRAWVEFSGAPSDDLAGLFDPRFLHDEDLAHVDAVWRNSIRNGTPLELELRLRRASDGVSLWHLVRAVPERDERGIVEGWIITAMDIDERRREAQMRAELLEREQHARAHAEAANRTKDEFLATVSHELRTPLNAILGWVHMLRAGMLDEARTARAIETIERNAHAQTQLVDDILDVSRIITGKLRLNLKPMQLRPVVQAAVETVKPAADAKGVALSCVFGSMADEEIAGDPGRIQQIIWNLVANAVKFTPRGGTVEVTVNRGGMQCDLTVSDSGAGISPDFLPFVFERFRQADSATTRNHGGLGLGLAIVRHLVELHGGTVRAMSTGLGNGASFTVTLPIRAADVDGREPDYFASQDIVPRRTPLPEARLDGLRVLFVDDDADARELLAELLVRSGATVIAAESAAEALTAVKEHSPDVLVSDIGLPNEDGYTLIKRIRALPASQGGRVPAIAVSGYARAEDRKRALAEGFQVHLAKPVEPSELVSLVASLAPSNRAALTPPAPPTSAAEQAT